MEVFKKPDEEKIAGQVEGELGLKFLYSLC